MHGHLVYFCTAFTCINLAFAISVQFKCGMKCTHFKFVLLQRSLKKFIQHGNFVAILVTNSFLFVSGNPKFICYVAFKAFWWFFTY